MQDFYDNSVKAESATCLKNCFTLSLTPDIRSSMNKPDSQGGPNVGQSLLLDRLRIRLSARRFR